MVGYGILRGSVESKGRRKHRAWTSSARRLCRLEVEEGVGLGWEKRRTKEIDTQTMFINIDFKNSYLQIMFVVLKKNLTNFKTYS